VGYGSAVSETEKQKDRMNYTKDTLPLRRGVVIRHDNVIRDSYGTPYERVNGGLRRVGSKRVGKQPLTPFNMAATLPEPLTLD